jgi:hypothetical protein
MTEDRSRQCATGEALHDKSNPQVLMESGSVRPGGDECGECRVTRGMPAISLDGQEVGWVAAIELDTTGRSTGLVMARPRTTLEYYYLPLALVSSVIDGRVLLQIRAVAARDLPRRRAGSKSGEGAGG